MLRTPIRDERGNCAIIAVLFVVVISAMGACLSSESGSDCYHTPGAQPGSAQDQRDVQHCIEGR